MNYVPVKPLNAADRARETLLIGEGCPVRERSQTDLRVRIPCTAADITVG